MDSLPAILTATTTARLSPKTTDMSPLAVPTHILCPYHDALKKDATGATRDGMSGMGMGGGNRTSATSCKIDMLWNWNTIDACFLTKQWHITSHGMFAGSCIGVILLVMVLEALRRSIKEYDRQLVRTHIEKSGGEQAPVKKVSVSSAESTAMFPAGAVPVMAEVAPFRPTIWQQAVRAGLHMLQFAVAYIIMLLAMYYNGYILMCIFIGAYLGSFVFHWETMTEGTGTSAAKEATVCCG